MVSNKGKLKVLDRSDIEAIHATSLKILSDVGVAIDSAPILDILERNGFIVDRVAKRVKMPESKVMEAVRSCKRNFRWYARSEKNSFDAVDGRTKFGPGAQCLNFIDPDSEEVRPTTLRDGVRICRMLDALDTSSLGYLPIYPNDVPEQAQSIVLWLAGLLNSSKPAFGGWGDDAQFELMLKMVDILFGDRELARKRAFFPAYIDPISPLGHDPAMLETIIRYAEWNIPVFVMVMALAGGTAPASLAGLLAQQNAEILSSIAVAKCMTKSPKIVYGSVSCPMDMRSGIPATGTPEFSLLGVGSVQMAKFYGLPSDMGVQSDSKTVDPQTSYEKMQSALMATMSGADFADLFLGSTETFSAFSPVQLMIDDEIASYALRAAEGIVVDEESLSLDVITKVGPMGSYLGHPRTIKQFRREHSQARLSDRQTRQQWVSSGSRDVKQRARERLTRLLGTHVPEAIEPEIRKRLSELLAGYTSQYSLEDLERI